MLKKPKIINSNLDLLRRTVDDFQRHTLVLEQLGEPIKHLSSFLVELLSEKLDSASLAAWEEAQADKSYTYSPAAQSDRKLLKLKLQTYFTAHGCEIFRIQTCCKFINEIFRHF